MATIISTYTISMMETIQQPMAVGRQHKEHLNHVGTISCVLALKVCVCVSTPVVTYTFWFHLSRIASGRLPSPLNKRHVSITWGPGLSPPTLSTRHLGITPPASGVL